MKLAFIGLKGHVGAILSGAKRLGNIELVAYSESTPSILESYSKQPMFAGAQGYEHWRHLFEHTQMDVCCVADESGVRYEQLVALMQRGVHIVSEKPLVTQAKDLSELRQEFRRSKSKLTMLLELRHQPKNVRVREIIQAGRIGEVCQVSTQKSYKWGERAEWLKSRERLGGTIPFIGIHSLDTIRWITGLDFRRVSAVHGLSSSERTGQTEDHASILAELTNGASVTARLDYLRPANAATHSDDRLRVIGTKGVIEVNEGDEAITLITDEQVERIPFGQTENLFVEFFNYIQGGLRPRITAADCFYITEVVLLARQAADEHRSFEIPASSAG